MNASMGGIASTARFSFLTAEEMESGFFTPSSRHKSRMMSVMVVVPSSTMPCITRLWNALSAATK